MLLLHLLACGLATPTARASESPDPFAVAAYPLKRACETGAVAVVDAGNTRWFTAWGRENTDTTPHGWGAVSTTLTAVAVMQLVEAGKVTLDSRVVDLDPRYAALGPPGTET